MSEIVQFTSSAALADAIDANLIEKSLSFPHFFGGEIHEPNPLWFVTGPTMPSNNGVVSAHFSASVVDAEIKALVKIFRAQKRSLTWWVGPRTVPSNLGQSLQHYGFTHNRDMIGMAMDLQDMEIPEAAQTMDFEPVQDRKTLRQWYEVVLECFPATYSQKYLDALAAISLRPGAEWLHYVGRVQGEILTASSLYLGGGVAGLYNLGTVVKARRRGLGAATTILSFAAARERGYRVGTLQTTYPNALRMYHHLGFEVYCKIGIYRYQPEGKG
ncbi:MAG: GNAT family N-acetyltransferase [Anaerolineae bacterium]|nr:GNAT family N-acetyltransferase [Anaerolineae bacterium]